MIIGVPKEIKEQEQRVALLPNLREIGGILRNRSSGVLGIFENIVDSGLGSGAQ